MGPVQGKSTALGHGRSGASSTCWLQHMRRTCAQATRVTHGGPPPTSNCSRNAASVPPRAGSRHTHSMTPATRQDGTETMTKGQRQPRAGPATRKAGRDLTCMAPMPALHAAPGTVAHTAGMPRHGAHTRPAPDAALPAESQPHHPSPTNPAMPCPTARPKPVLSCTMLLTPARLEGSYRSPSRLNTMGSAPAEENRQPTRSVAGSTTAQGCSCGLVHTADACRQGSCPRGALPRGLGWL